MPSSQFVLIFRNKMVSKLSLKITTNEKTGDHSKRHIYSLVDYDVCSRETTFPTGVSSENSSCHEIRSFGGHVSGIASPIGLRGAIKKFSPDLVLFRIKLK